MKTLFVIAAFLFTHSSFSQTWDEWTKQKKTQIRYLLQQISANKVYLEHLENGYKIANEGLNTIQKIKKGDFDLNQEFIGSLLKVNPRLKDYKRVADIISLQIRIAQTIGTVSNKVSRSEHFSRREVDYVKGIFANLLAESIENIDELYSIVTSGDLNLKDDERIKQIDKLYYEIRDKYTFCKSFGEECSILAVQRFRESIETEMSKKLIDGK